ncbi:hypothetical protein Lal_00015312 [Lupinus albus]|nr:hypothetical protein Lal_00015312 [Lupinus albus]
MATQVKPKLSNEDSVSMFIDTLQPPFYSMMLGCASVGFRQLMTIGKNRKSLEKWQIRNISKAEEKKSHYDAIPMSCSKLLPQLVQRGLLTILPFKEVVPPYPNGFNPNACCMYHGGTVGHLTEDCNQLKGKVRELIREGLVKFQGSVLI